MSRIKKYDVLFLGCGFLATHILPCILSFCKKLILVDKERVEKVNYDNALYLKGFVNRRKVSALGNLAQLLSSVPMIPIHKELRNEQDLKDLPLADFAFITFDNIKARQLAQKLTIPALQVGVTENYAVVEWNSHVMLPTTSDEMARVEAEMRQIRDACSRIEFRTLGAMAASLASHAFYVWCQERKKMAFYLTIQDNNIRVTSFDRTPSTSPDGAVNSR